MSLSSLQFQGIRNLEAGVLAPASRLNWFYGDNGAGKSSVLEAVFLLGHGRSFRTATVERVITDSEGLLRVVAEIGAPVSGRMGLERDRKGDTRLRVDGQDVRRLSDLAARLPVLALTPDTQRLLSDGPRERRRFIDWAVFHVEHGFSVVAQRYAKVVQQRNAALKAGADERQLDSWDAQLLALAEPLDAARRRYLQRLLPRFEAKWLATGIRVGLSVDWFSGWAADRSLADALRESRSSDREAGSTRVGPHRADLRVKAGRVAAAETLSRGQSRLAVQLLHLAQAEEVTQGASRHLVLLLDDLGADLDAQRQLEFVESALALPGLQLFVTATTAAPAGLLERYNGAMFHVEHGRIRCLTPEAGSAAVNDRDDG